MQNRNVVIIGRPNVGKSTLFNRISGTRHALVHHRPGTTRDRKDTPIAWKGETFHLVDTAGWAENEIIFSAALRKQLTIALSRADLVLFIVDGKEGLHPYDAEVAKILRREKKNIILIVNKIDSQKEEDRAAEFYRLGFSDIMPISANHGLNIAELMDRIIANLPASGPAEPEKQAIRVILVGKPNVGKSSLVNTLSREERSIVHDLPGTTREALDIGITHNGQDFVLIDTPGLHRKHKFTDDMEYLSALSTHHAMERADVAVLVMDLTQGIGETEARVAELALNNHKACVLVVNKWDLMEEREEMVKTVRRQLDAKLPFLWWTKLVFVSAKTGQRTERILDEVYGTYNEYSKTVPQAELSEVIRHAEGRKPLSRQGHPLRIRKVEQVDIRPPTFIFTVNDPTLVHFSYRRYLENNIRERFGFSGTPLILKFGRENERKNKK
jgi:GTP-binding protein